ncbi:MAG: hypothetical protein ABIB43_00145 [archaeon]
MKISAWIISVLFFIIFINSAYAVCEESLIAYHSCLDACPDPIKDTFGAAECGNVCIASWQKDTDAYYKCQEQERLEEENRAKEQNTLPEKVTYPTYQEISYDINSYKGEVELTRSHIVFPVNFDFRVFPGDSIRTGKDGFIEMASDDSTSRYGPDTLGKMLGLDPANSRVVPSHFIDWDKDPNYKHKLDNWEFWSNTLIDLADFINKNRPDFLESCFGEDIYGCTKGIVEFIDGGVGWFNDKMDQDFKKRMVVTPTAAIFPMDTEFIVEVTSDGTTTVTTLNGTVIVIDLTSRNGIIVESNNQVTIPNTETGLGEQELQQNLIEVNAELVDKWWIKDDDAPKIETLIFSYITLLIAIIVISMIILLLFKRKKLNKK